MLIWGITSIIITVQCMFRKCYCWLLSIWYAILGLICFKYWKHINYWSFIYIKYHTSSTTVSMYVHIPTFIFIYNIPYYHKHSYIRSGYNIFTAQYPVLVAMATLSCIAINIEIWNPFNCTQQFSGNACYYLVILALFKWYLIWHGCIFIQCILLFLSQFIDVKVPFVSWKCIFW